MASKRSRLTWTSSSLYQLAIHHCNSASLIDQNGLQDGSANSSLPIRLAVFSKPVPDASPHTNGLLFELYYGHCLPLRYVCVSLYLLKTEDAPYFQLGDHPNCGDVVHFTWRNITDSKTSKLLIVIPPSLVIILSLQSTYPSLLNPALAHNTMASLTRSLPRAFRQVRPRHLQSLTTARLTTHDARNPPKGNETITGRAPPTPPQEEASVLKDNSAPSSYLGTTKRLPEFNLNDKVVLVTGGARGLGLVQAEALLEAGATVYALDRLPEPSPDFYRVQKRAAEELGKSLRPG